MCRVASPEGPVVGKGQRTCSSRNSNIEREMLDAQLSPDTTCGTGTRIQRQGGREVGRQGRRSGADYQHLISSPVSVSATPTRVTAAFHFRTRTQLPDAQSSRPGPPFFTEREKERKERDAR
jgi:hypothetical protein